MISMCIVLTTFVLIGVWMVVGSCATLGLVEERAT